MPNAPLSATEHSALFTILRAHAPRTVFAALSIYYDAAAALADIQLRPDQAAGCAVARDSCEMAIGLLGELDAANELRIYELVETLRASIAQRKAAAAA